MEQKDKDIEKLFEEAKKVSLNKERKDAIRLAILSDTNKQTYNENKPIRSYFSSWSFIHISYVPLLLAIVFVGGGVSLAAEKAIPGNILYPIKTGFNEQVSRMLSISTESKADWESKVAIRRLEEVVELGVSGSTRENEEVVEENFVRHAERFAQKVEELKDRGDVDKAKKLEENFAKSVEKHTEVLARLDKKGQKVSNTLARLGLPVADKNSVADEVPGRVIAINNLPPQAEDNQNDSDMENNKAEPEAEGSDESGGTSIMSLTTPTIENERGISLQADNIANVSYKSEGLKEVYSRNDIIEIELTAINKADETIELNLTHNCEFYYSIGGFNSSDQNSCTFSIVKILLSPGKSHIWNIEIDLNKISIEPGEYELIYGISGGYFEDSKKITIE